MGYVSIGGDDMDELATELAAIGLFDMIHSYDDRNRCVVKAVWLALHQGLRAGFRLDEKEPEWPVAFIELPTGQVSWHLPQHSSAWDEHTSEEKQARCLQFIREYGEPCN